MIGMEETHMKNDWYGKDPSEKYLVWNPSGSDGSQQGRGGD